MPIYEYRCEDCELEFEMLLLDRQESVSCPRCHGARLKKQISAHAVGGGGAPACAEAPVCGEGGCPACQG